MSTKNNKVAWFPKIKIYLANRRPYYQFIYFHKMATAYAQILKLSRQNKAKEKIR